MHGGAVNAQPGASLSILERLVGATGDPDKVTKAAQILADQ